MNFKRFLVRPRYIPRSQRRGTYWGAICLFVFIGAISWIFRLGSPGVAVLVTLGILVAVAGLTYELMAHRLMRRTNEVISVIEFFALILIGIILLAKLFLP